MNDKTVMDLMKALPKEDYLTAKSLYNKKDYYNLGYLVWSNLSNMKRNSGDYPAEAINSLQKLNDMFSK